MGPRWSMWAAIGLLVVGVAFVVDGGGAGSMQVRSVLRVVGMFLLTLVVPFTIIAAVDEVQRRG